MLWTNKTLLQANLWFSAALYILFWCKYQKQTRYITLPAPIGWGLDSSLTQLAERLIFNQKPSFGQECHSSHILHRFCLRRRRFDSLTFARHSNAVPQQNIGRVSNATVSFVSCTSYIRTHPICPNAHILPPLFCETSQVPDIFFAGLSSKGSFFSTINGGMLSYLKDPGYLLSLPHFPDSYQTRCLTSTFNRIDP